MTVTQVGSKPEVQLDIANRFAEGETVADLALEYQVSRTTITKAIRSMGGKLRHRTPRTRQGDWYKQNHGGYVRWVLYMPPHKRRHPANEKALILEHRLVMEEAIGRPLGAHEQVHHRNGIKSDNRLENLELRIGPHGIGATHCPHCGGSLTEGTP